MRGEGIAELVEVAAGGAGGRAAYTWLPQAVGDEVDDALLGLEGPAHALGGPGLLAAEDEAGVADRPAVTHGGNGAGIRQRPGGVRLVHGCQRVVSGARGGPSCSPSDGGRG